MHTSNLRLLLSALVAWWAWGTAYVVPVYIVLAFLLGFWSIWASQGMTIRRKLQIASWDEPKEGCIHGKISLDATNVLSYIEKKRKQTGDHITVTHVVGKIMGLILKEATGLNGRIVMDRFVPFKTSDVSFLTVLEGGKNLAKVKVTSIDTKPIEQIAKELEKGADKLRKGDDENFKKSMGPLHFLPTFLIRIIVFLAGYAAGALGADVPFLGLESFPFGSCLITSVGMLGVDEAFAPFTPFTRVPILVLIGAVKDGVIPIDGKVEIRKKIKITATIDHRFMDGSQGGILARVMREVFANPDLLDK